MRSGLFVCYVVAHRSPLLFLVFRARSEWYVKDSDAARHSDMLESARVYDLITNTTERSTVSFTQLFMYATEDGKDQVKGAF